MVRLSLHLSHDQKVQTLTQLTQTWHKGVAMTKCSTRGVDYTTKNVECLRCNLVGELKNYTLLVVFYQTKNISLERSPVTLPLPLTVRKWQTSKSKQHSWMNSHSAGDWGAWLWGSRWDSLAEDRERNTGRGIPGWCREESNRPLLPLQEALFFPWGCFGTQKLQLSSSLASMGREKSLGKRIKWRN